MAGGPEDSGFRIDITRAERNERDQTEVTKEVLEKELKDIDVRRAAMFDDDRSTNVEKENWLVGLALSGGGIRSASFNFGLLQAFIETGLIRWVDYLSTVSGGGYIGGCLSTVLNEARKDAVKNPPDAPPGIDRTIRAPGHVELELEKACKQRRRKRVESIWRTLAFPPKQGPAPGKKNLDSSSELKTPFYRGGQYTRDGMHFAETLIVGGLLNALVWGGLLVAFTAFLAMLWRALDCPELVMWIRDRAPRFHDKLWTDVGRPFMIPLALFLGLLLWRLVAAAIRLFRPRFQAGLKSPRFFFIILASCAVGAAVFLANSEVAGAPNQNGNPPLMQSGSNPLWVLLPSLAAMLLPYLNPRRLARSEMRPENRTESLLKNFAGMGLCLLLPFTAVYLFALEDQLGEAAGKERAMSYVDFYSVPKFLSQLELEKEDQDSVGAIARKRIKDQWTGPEIVGDLNVLEASLAKANGTVPDQSASQQDVESKETFDRTIKHLTQLAGYVSRQETSHEATRRWWQNPNYEGRVLRQEWDIRRKIGEHLARVMDAHVLTDPAIVGALREQFKLLTEEEESQAFMARMASLSEGREFLDKLWPKYIATGGKLTEQELKQANRLILEATYPTLIRERSLVSFHMTWSADQWNRWWWCWRGFAVFLIASVLINVNATSLQNFYREKLNDSYFVGESKLSELDTTSVGGPYQLFCAAVNFIDDYPWRAEEFSQTYTFVFSRHFCGSQAFVPEAARSATHGWFTLGRPLSHGYAPTELYCRNQLDVPTVAAISGAAFSPAIFQNPFTLFGSYLLNFRLGQWMRNPMHISGDEVRKPRPWDRVMAYFTPSLIIVWSFFVTLFLKLRKPEDWRYCFVSDGGHNDNLGLSPLVLRRCKLIIVSDASQDENYRFEELLSFYRRIRTRFGMDLVNWFGDSKGHAKRINLAPIRPRKVAASRTRERRLSSQLFDAISGWWHKHESAEDNLGALSREHFMFSRLVYPEKDEWALLVYIKPTFTGDEPTDVAEYRLQNPAFPQDPTSDLIFSDDRVDAYRRLGKHIGLQLCERIERDISSGDGQQLWTKRYSVEHLIARLTRPRRGRRFAYDDPKIAKLFRALDGDPEAARAASEELCKAGPRVLAALELVLTSKVTVTKNRVTTKEYKHSDSQRSQAMRCIYQICEAHLNSLSDFKKLQAKAVASTAVEKDPDPSVKNWARKVLDL